jgi:hypothetical protein
MLNVWTVGSLSATYSWFLEGVQLLVGKQRSLAVLT